MNKEPLLTFVVSTYYGHTKGQASCLIGSLQSQTRDDFKVLIVYDGSASEDFRNHINYLIKDDSRFEFIETIEKKPENEFGNFWRSWAAENKVDSVWCHFTNLDNIYNKVFVEEMLNKAVMTDADIVMNNIVHRYAGGPGRDKAWQVLSSQPVVNWCDYQSYIIKTDIVKKVKFNHQSWAGQDGALVQEAVDWLGASVSKVELLILGTHQ